MGGGRRRCLRLGLGAQPAGPAAVAYQGLGRDGRLLGQVVVDVTAAAGQRHDDEDQGEQALRPHPQGVGERIVVGDVEGAAGRGQFEALGPAVDRGGGERLAVEGGGPALGGGVGQAQDAALRAVLDLGVDLDRSRGHGLRLALAPGGHDGGAGDLPVHPPQRAARLLAE